MFKRREFLAGMLAAPVVPAKAAWEAPVRAANVTKLFKSPDGHPNGLATSEQGLWIGEQITNRAHLLDWNGRLIKTVETESSNTSGIAHGGGCLWMAANGKALWRPARPTDAATGQIIQVDPPLPD